MESTDRAMSSAGRFFCPLNTTCSMKLESPFSSCSTRAVLQHSKWNVKITIVAQTIVGLELPDIQAALGKDVPRFRARQIYDAVYRQKVSDLVDISTLPAEFRKDLATHHEVGLPGIAASFQSTDGTVRYLLKLADGRTVETVLMPEEGRDTICISSQVGCPVNCSFCLTALMGLERNLTAGEIVGQVLFVLKAHGLAAMLHRLNVVMMGHGEPLLNLPAVLKATRLLTDTAGIAISPRPITLS